MVYQRADAKVINKKWVYENTKFNDVSGVSWTEFDGSNTAQFKNFYSLDKPNGVVYEMASIKGDNSELCSFDPYHEIRFNLTQGGTYGSRSTKTCIPAGGTTQPKITSLSVSATFNNFEKVTVPAGEFDACKYTFKTTEGGKSEEVTKWYRQGDGVTLRFDVNGAKREELVSFTPAAN